MNQPLRPLFFLMKHLKACCSRLPGELSMEELLQRYAGAYASDASAPGSGSSEEEDEDEVEG